VSEMAPEPVLVWVTTWLEGGVTQHRYYDRPEPAEQQAAGVTARTNNAITPLVYAMTVYPEAEEQESA
jgi:hypothetical protein